MCSNIIQNYFFRRYLEERKCTLHVGKYGSNGRTRWWNTKNLWSVSVCCIILPPELDSHHLLNHLHHLLTLPLPSSGYFTWSDDGSCSVHQTGYSSTGNVAEVCMQYDVSGFLKSQAGVRWLECFPIRQHRQSVLNRSNDKSLSTKDLESHM